jgi:hypothetical protein
MRVRKIEKLKADIDEAKMDIEVWTKMYEDPEVHNNFAKLKLVGEKIRGFQDRLRTLEADLAKV